MRTGEIPRVIGGGSQLLVESPWAFRPGFWDKYWKTGVEAWISRHVELYYITTCLSREGDGSKGQRGRQQVPPNDSTVVEQVHDTSASVGLLRQQWFLRWSKSKDVEYHRRPVGAKQAPSRQVPKAGRRFTGFSLSEFSPQMYSPRGPSRDPNRTLSKE